MGDAMGKYCPVNCLLMCVLIALALPIDLPVDVAVDPLPCTSKGYALGYASFGSQAIAQPSESHGQIYPAIQ